jgi:hypothetical protein
MDPALVSAMSAVLGSVVGASATVATARMTQSAQNKREQIRAELAKRETLYGEFISECSKLAIDSLANGIEAPEKMWSAYALLNRIRLSASEPVLAEAEAVLKRIAEQYFAPNISLEEFRAIALAREGDPLTSFGEACRMEIKAIAARHSAQNDGCRL